MFEYQAEITRVVDGDTVDAIVDLGFSIKFKERFRLLGINAPETRTRNKKEKAAGLKATLFLKQAFGWDPERGGETAHRSAVLRTQKDAKGKYGRYIAELVLGQDSEFMFVGRLVKLAAGTNLNDELVRRRLAKRVKY